MGKKSSKKRKKLIPSFSGFDIDPDTQRGILAVVLLVCGLLTALSLFGVAGEIGNLVATVLTKLVGLGRYVVPIIFFIVVYSLLYPQDYEIRPIYLVGLILFGIGVVGLLDVMNPGLSGYVGIASTYLFREFASTVVAFVVFMACFVISILIIFNTSLDRIAQHIPATSIMGKFLRFIVTIFSSARDRIAVAREQALSEVEEQYYDDEYSNEAEDEGGASEFSRKSISSTDDDEDTEGDDIDEEGQMELIHLSKQHRAIDLPLSLLSKKRSKPTSGDIENNREIIHQTLQNFNIDVDMGDISVGPTVTQYTFKPARGVKVSQIMSLQNDIALALAAHPIRVEAPIPGKSLVGIEVPNITAARVSLRELLESDEFKNRKSNLSVMLGKDVSGKAYSADVASMPHLLIAGATGSGKSVCLNVVLLSLLFQNGPDDLKIIMVDPKRVEFTMYNEIPHLLTPVITDVQKTINALKWCVNEMDRRYEVLSQAKKRDIASYNSAHPDATMPFIVFVVDELADLMATAPREVEAAVVRLAQMARAVGIHLILATQRPSVDVITGLIKANITSRCAFNTASLVDSRTILDSSGAEKLLGKGDMLYVNAESSKPKRIQGVYVSDDEVTRVVAYLKSKAKADYDDEVIDRQKSSSLPEAFNDASDEDDLLPDAKEVIIKSKKASASLLQRRLRVGYARAARLLDILEEQGFIGPANGAKPRELLMSDEELEQYDQPQVDESIDDDDDDDNDDDDEGEITTSDYEEEDNYDEDTTERMNDYTEKDE
ncbi:MAG: DNA translocase FtsK [bacterium]|nr:DNA translocase FtsK [bacterium]